MAAADTKLAQELGVAASVIEDLRVNSLVEGAGWLREGRTVRFTDEGIVRISEILGAKKEGPPEAGAVPEEVLLQVVGLLPNVRFVRVKAPEGVAVVAVRDNRRLRVRHLLRCRQIEGQWHCTQHGIAPHSHPQPILP